MAWLNTEHWPLNTENGQRYGMSGHDITWPFSQNYLFQTMCSIFTIEHRQQILQIQQMYEGTSAQNRFVLHFSLVNISFAIPNRRWWKWLFFEMHKSGKIQFESDIFCGFGQILKHFSFIILLSILSRAVLTIILLRHFFHRTVGGAKFVVWRNAERWALYSFV